MTIIDEVNQKPVDWELWIKLLKKSAVKVHKLHIKETVPSKKNSYRIRYARDFLATIQHIIQAFKMYKKATVWIGPTDAVKQFEMLVAWTATVAIPKDYQPGDRLGIQITYQGKADLDNMLGAILDGLQQSGRVPNDKQFKDIHILEGDTSGGGCIIEVWQINQETNTPSRSG